VRLKYGLKNITPTYNTDTTSKYGLFHHLSYLTKVDPLQALPSNYKGKSFGVSQLKPEKLTNNPYIKKHKLTTSIKIEEDLLDDYTVTITPLDEIRSQIDSKPF